MLDKTSKQQDNVQKQKEEKEKELQVFIPGFSLALENLEKCEKFFQSGKSQGILKFYQKVREKSGNFV